MIRGVIFDLDGVLVSTDEFHYRAWKRMADEEGIPFDRQVNERLRGVSRMDSLGIILERAPRPYSEQEKLALAERKNGYYRDSLQGLSPSDALPGAFETLAELRRRGVKTAIASSSKNASLILERIGLAGKTDAAVDGNDITRSKPHPEVFLLAAERLGLPPAACLVVEDAAAGVEAAHRAAMPALGLGPPDRLPDADHVAACLADVPVEQLLAIRRPSPPSAPG